ncbi:MAG: preprotein translocase subunit SecY, partial [Acholeplasmatales bacterium]|nr:preprotein translocase subunit SecY [Acholeplasmatales bacterium]
MGRLKAILTNKSILIKILITFALLLLFRVLIFVHIPLMDTLSMESWIKSNDFLQILNNFGGNAIEQGSILALGISPYITSSIIVQLLQTVIPQLKEWQDQGDAGRQKASKFTRYLAFALAYIQGLLLILGRANGELANILYVSPAFMQNGFAVGFAAYVFMPLAIVAGTCICIWIADLITKKGIGNGSSMLITAGIVVSIPSMGTSLWSKFITGTADAPAGKWYQILYFIIVILVYIGVILLVTFIQSSTRKIPIQYANRQGKSNSDIPLKLNSASVMPVIFASTVLSIPLTIAGFFSVDSSAGVGFWLNEIFNNRKTIGLVIYILLIVIFSFFYSFMQTSPNKIADNLSKSNAFIPGVRPGEDTKNFVARLLFKVTVIGTIYLVFVAVLPILICQIFGLSNNISIGGTSLL